MFLKINLFSWWNVKLRSFFFFKKWKLIYFMLEGMSHQEIFKIIYVSFFWLKKSGLQQKYLRMNNAEFTWTSLDSKI